MKKTKLIPLGIAGCLALGLYANVTTDSEAIIAASVGDVFDVDDSLVDSIFAKFEGNSGPELNTSGIGAIAALPLAGEISLDNAGKESGLAVNVRAEANEAKPESVTEAASDEKPEGKETAVQAEDEKKEDTTPAVVAFAQEDTVRTVEDNEPAEVQNVEVDNDRTETSVRESKAEVTSVAPEVKSAGTGAVKAVRAAAGTEVEKEEVIREEIKAEDKVLGNIEIDPGEGWESTYIAGEEITSTSDYIYPNKEVSFAVHSISYDNNPSANTLDYFVNNKKVSASVYARELEKCKSDMSAGLCEAQIASSLAPIIFRDKVMDEVYLDDGIEWFDIEEDVHEHTLTPVYKTVHHDAVTHTEQVWREVLDNNRSYTYEDSEGNLLGYCAILGTIVTYENDEVVSVEGSSEKSLCPVQLLSDRHLVIW